MKARFLQGGRLWRQTGLSMVFERYGWVLPAIFLLALALRLWNINAASLWIDEIYSLITANTHFSPAALDLKPHSALWYDRLCLAWQPLAWPALISLLKMNVHVPLYYSLLNPWLGLFGNHAVGLRSFSALFSALLVFPLASLGNALSATEIVPGLSEKIHLEKKWVQFIGSYFRQKPGFFVALAAALSPFQLYYGQEGRMYALLLFWATCSALAFWKVLYGSHPRRWSVFYAISLLAGFFSHYMFIFFLGFQGIYGLCWLLMRHTGWNRERVLLLLTPLGVLMMAAMAWFPIYRVQQQGVDADYHFAKGLLAPLRYLTVLLWQPLTMASGDNSWQRLFYIPLTLILSALALIRRSRECFQSSLSYFQREGFLLAWIFVPLLLQIAYDLLKHTHTSVIDRYALLISPALCLVLGLGLHRLFLDWPKKGWVTLSLMVALAVAAVWSPSPFRDEHNKDKNIRAKMATMVRLARPDDLIFVNGPWGAPAMASYYLVREKSSLPGSLVASEKLPLLYWISVYRGQRVPLPPAARLQSYRRVWLFRYRANNERGLQRAKDYLHALYPKLARIGDWFLYSRPAP